MRIVNFIEYTNNITSSGVSVISAVSKLGHVMEASLCGFVIFLPFWPPDLLRK